MLRHVVEGCPPAPWRLAGEALDGLATAVEPIRLLFPAQLVRVFMDIAMMANLVTAFDNRLNGPGILLDAPGRNEKRLLDLETPVGFHNSRDRYVRSVLQHRDTGNAGRRVFRVCHMKDAVCIHVKGKSDCTTCAIWPGNRIANHACSLPYAICAGKGPCKIYRENSGVRQERHQYS
ncbi:hypothetical protein D3C85_1154140 [compost metagenome]